MVAGWAGFAHNGQAIGIKTGQQNTTFDLCAGDRQGIIHATQPSRRDTKRRIIAILPPDNLRAHAAHWSDPANNPLSGITGAPMVDTSSGV